MRTTIMLVGMTCLLSASGLCAQDSMLIERFETLDGWATGGQKEISFDLSEEHVKEGEHSLHLHVEIDHENAEEVREVKYPMGWPSVRKEYETGIDLSQYDFLEFDVYFESQRGVDPDFAMNVTVRTGDERGIYRAVLTDLRHGKWAHEKLCIRDVATAEDLAWVSFWLSESTYDHGAVIDFQRIVESQPLNFSFSFFAIGHITNGCTYFIGCLTYTGMITGID